MGYDCNGTNLYNKREYNQQYISSYFSIENETIVVQSLKRLPKHIKGLVLRHKHNGIQVGQVIINGNH